MTAGNEPGPIWTDVRFWMQVLNDAKRTIVCHPDIEERVKEVVERAGLSHLMTLKPNQYSPMDQVLVIDERAMKADMARRAGRVSWKYDD